jgi:hypothetical protein
MEFLIQNKNKDGARRKIIRNNLKADEKRQKIFLYYKVIQVSEEKGDHIN